MTDVQPTQDNTRKSVISDKMQAAGDAVKDFGGFMSQTFGQGAGQQIVGGASMLGALGTKIGSAVAQAKANRYALSAANQNAASARDNLAAAGNPMANNAVQSAVTSAEQQIADQARQNEQLASVTGATPEQKMAQYQMAQQALADVYGNVAANAGANYMDAKNAAAQADIDTVNLRSQQYANKAAQLNTAAGNLFKTGQKTLVGGVK